MRKARSDWSDQRRLQPGATLYALIAGKGPFSGRNLPETLRQLCELEPEPLSRLNPSVPRDLEAICLKAMNKRPDARYASAREMAEDLERFLDGRPVVARMPGAAERLLRSLCRHPARCAAVFAAIAILAVVSTQQFELPMVRDRLDPQDRRELRLAVNRSYEAELRRGVERGEILIRDHPESREGRRSLASIYHRLGELLVNTDRLADALWAYDRGGTLLRQHLRDEPGDVTSQIELADVLGSLGEASWALGRASDARAAYREAVIVRQGVVASHSEVRAYRDDLTRTLKRLNQLSSTTGPG